MANWFKSPIYLFFVACFGAMIVGLALQVAGVGRKIGFVVAIIGFGLAWLPAIGALVLNVVEAIKRRRAS